MQWADLVVTMGCGDECPFIPGKRYLDWELPDPADSRCLQYGRSETGSPSASTPCSTSSATHRE